jgi:hypothetical protein
MQWFKPKPVHAAVAVILFVLLGPPIGALVFAFTGNAPRPPNLFVFVFVFSYLVAFKQGTVAGVIFSTICSGIAKAIKPETPPVLPAMAIGAASGVVASYLVPVGSPTYPGVGKMLLVSSLASACVAGISARYFPIGKRPVSPC